MLAPPFRVEYRAGVARKHVGALLLPLLVVACHRSPPPPPAPSASASALAAPGRDASAVATAFDTSTVVDAGATCRPTQVQTDACVSTHADFSLDDAAIRGWITAHGGKAAEIVPDACREASLVGVAEPVLVCLAHRGSVVDNALGSAGPILFNYDVEVLAIRQKHVTTILKQPFALGDNGATYSAPSTMYFSAEVSVTADAVDIVATPADCTKSLAALPAFFAKRKAALAANAQLPPETLAQLVRATGHEEKQTSARMSAICHAAGHYTPGPGGKLTTKK